RTPVWFRWYFWADPFAWTLYGMVASQFGDYQNKLDNGEGLTVEEFLRSYFGYEHEFLGLFSLACRFSLLSSLPMA
ncbi:hypothetical protein RJ641_020061, partial [Dillenia turbinata]